MGIPAHATPTGTARYATARATPAAYAALGSTGLVTSRLGFGGYRVDDETPEHRAALEAALDGGVNLIDTSTNSADGGSERLVGRVLDARARAGRLSRDALVVVSKLGYVQGSTLQRARDREAAGQPFPEMVKYADGCWHSIHPEFLADQLARSLERLGLATLDVCLLHNPEYFLSDAERRRSGPLPARREGFYRRVRAAFAFLEGEVAAGRLRWYGVSSNTVTRPVDDPEATSLAEFLAAARAAGGEGHHFRVLQCPMNLVEAGAFVEVNNPPAAPRETVLGLAAREGLGVLLNRPLNAMVRDRLLRLADVPLDGPAIDVDAQLERVRSLEAEYRREIAARIHVGPDSTPPDEFFRWADRLAGFRQRAVSPEHWREIEGRMVRPVVTQVVRALDAGLAGALAGGWLGWRDRYLPEIARLLEAFRQHAATGASAASRAVAAAIDPALPPERRAAPLSRKALWTLASTPGVGVVLVGMRRPEYVADALPILAWPPLAPVDPVYVRAQRLDPGP
jgi:aryl-alcohol dehydrogenase-like predicted oxidoreductase